MFSKLPRTPFLSLPYPQIDMKRTSLILDFKNGFLIYHVEVRNVRMKTRSSVFPANSNFSGDVLGTKSEDRFA